ncbi:TPA: transposase [Pseudomonas aeruginosa]|nr:transposase [Pseudomonas aeruginosa]
MANRHPSKEIRTIHHDANGIYGHRRIKAELATMGMRVIGTELPD